MLIPPEAGPYAVIAAAIVGGAVAVWKLWPKAWRSQNGTLKCQAVESLKEHRDEIIPIMHKQTEILARQSETLAILADRTARR